MKKLAQTGLIVMFLLLGIKGKVLAVNKVTPTVVASSSAEASLAATIEPTPTVKNITEAGGNDKVVVSEVEKWNGFNGIRVLVSRAIDRGVAGNTIVLLLLLPLLATLVSVLHYVVGVSGYGIFIPTMLAVTFLATGIFGGLLLFAIILIVSLLSNVFLRKLKIHFWPARAMNLLFISLGTFLVMVVSASVSLFDISNISIFPILFMILLAEEFTRTQLAKSKNEARRLVIGTIVLAIVGAILMNFESIQQIVLKYPGWMIISVIVINLLVGNYTGMRLLEIKRFRKAIRDSGKQNK